jgi:uncharacterized protein (TIGR04551 family)
MRRRLLLTSVMSLCAPVFAGALIAGLPAVVLAQATPDAAAPAAEPAEPSEPEPANPEGEPAAAEPAQAPAPGGSLQPPQLAPLDLDVSKSANATAPGPTLPDPAEAAKQLAEAAPPPVQKKGWTLSETAFHLHGYLRMRGTLLKDGSLGHTNGLDRLPTDDKGVAHSNYDPFPYFQPYDRADPTPTTSDPMNKAVLGGCGDTSGAATSSGSCSKRSQVSGDLRLRLKPEIALSDDVRVKAWIDVLDNVGLGTMGYGANNNYTPNDVTAGNAIKVRRVWGEARNRGIGELRFGRMGADWGLGILDNGGDRYGIDSDFSSDVDRIMGITNFAGFYFMAAYDWATEGKVLPGSATPSGVPIDRAQNDDQDVFTAAVAHRLEPEAQQGALLRGEPVFNYGVYFKYSDQLLKSNSPSAAAMAKSDVQPEVAPFIRLNQTQYVPDLWLQYLREGLRLELEAAFVAGSLEGGCPRILYDEKLGNTNYDNGKTATEIVASGDNTTNTTRSNKGQCKFRQLGLALEAEYRLFDDKLGIHFDSGLATGDANARGLAATNDPSLQRVYKGNQRGDNVISTYQFHPDYRVDLILWRTVMRRVAGAYYFKPGISYDFIHDPYGQRAGGRLDVIYSRASSPKQTWGNSGNLGLELDVSLYYRSEDGPDLLDGFYGLVQWGVLFPFQGLDYASSYNTMGAKGHNAMVFRGIAGISF